MVRQLLTRSLPSSLEVREEEGKRHITGVIPYDSQSEDLGGFREVIRKGAFRKTLLEGDARCLWAHNTQYVLGRRSAGTLTFDDRDDARRSGSELRVLRHQGLVDQGGEKGARSQGAS